MIKPNSKPEEHRQGLSHFGIITNIVVMYTNRKTISLSCLLAFLLAWFLFAFLFFTMAKCYVWYKNSNEIDKIYWNSQG